eukprot:6408158-Amphidinium_carterae.3
MCETTTAFGCATVAQKNGAAYDAIQAVKRFIVVNGLQTTILKSDSEASIIELTRLPGRCLIYNVNKLHTIHTNREVQLKDTIRHHLRS